MYGSVRHIQTSWGRACSEFRLLHDWNDRQVYHGFLLITHLFGIAGDVCVSEYVCLGYISVRGLAASTCHLREAIKMSRFFFGLVSELSCSFPIYLQPFRDSEMELRTWSFQSAFTEFHHWTTDWWGCWTIWRKGGGCRMPSKYKKELLAAAKGRKILN